MRILSVAVWTILGASAVVHAKSGNGNNGNGNANGNGNGQSASSESEATQDTPQVGHTVTVGDQQTTFDPDDPNAPPEDLVLDDVQPLDVPPEFGEWPQNEGKTVDGTTGATATGGDAGDSSPGGGGESGGPGNSGGNYGQSKKVDVDASDSIADAVAGVKGNQGKNAEGQVNLKNLKFPSGKGTTKAPRDVKLSLASAMNEGTTYSSYRESPGTIHQVNNLKDILVSSGDEYDTDLILQVEDDGGVEGIAVDKSGKNGNGGVKTVKQNAGGGETAVEDAPEFDPPAFACDAVDHDGRRLDDIDHRHDHHDHDHDHHGHHHDHGHDYHDHDHGLEGKDVLDMFEEQAANLRGLGVRGIKQNRRKLYYTDTFPKRYSFQVDLYIEIDDQFVTEAKRNTDASDDLQEAIDYVNLLVTGANMVYERETDTHLHVAHVELTNRYDGDNSARAALATMEGYYRANGFGSGFEDVDLHHALIGRSLGGGVAYLGAVCNDYYGFGVSGSLAGNFVAMDQGTLWDMVVFMHEVGHNFNADHTHYSSYDPVIDQCGNSCGTALDDGLSTGSATIMSYCHLCGEGRINNVAYTFGGDRGEEGGTGAWQNNAAIGDFSNEPHQVPERMYNFISGLGTCVAPPDERPFQGTPPPTISLAPTVSSYPTAAPTTDSPTLSFHPSANPTISFAPSGSPTNNPTFGPTSEARLALDQPEYDHFQIVPGFMFDVVAKENIIIHNMEYLMYTRTAVTLDIFTTPGSFLPVKRSEANWTQIASVPNLAADGCLDNDRMLPRHSFAPIRIAAGERLGFYFRILDTNNQRLALDNKGSSSTGDYEVFLENSDIGITSGVFKDRWDHHSGTAYNSYRYTGKILYTIDGTRRPTGSPTVAPTHTNPTVSPTHLPTIAPTDAKLVLSKPSTSSTLSTYGAMFDVMATADGAGMMITSFDVTLKDEGPPVTLEIFTLEGPHEPHHSDSSAWTKIGEVSDLWGDDSWPSHRPVRLPPGSFPPQPVEAGSTRAFYIRLKDPSTANNYLTLDYTTSDYNGPYFSDANGIVCQGRAKGSTEWSHTYMQTIGWQGDIFYEELGSYPPTRSPTDHPSASPSASPSQSPTKEGTTPTPTLPPTPLPTASPTSGPSASPTASPTPGTHTLAVPASTSGYYLKMGGYFDVVAGETPVVVTDIRLYTPYSGRIKAYSHVGPCTGTNTDPSLWDQIADTVSTWKSGYSMGNPSWTFEPVVVPAHTTRAFYVKSSYYLYALSSGGSSMRWTEFVKNVDAPSLTLLHGRGAGNTDWTTSGDTNLYMEIEYRDLGPTASPTQSPTNYPTISAAPSVSAAPSTAFTEERAIGHPVCSSCYSGYGQQFELLPLKDMQITGLDVRLSDSRSHRIQVYRLQQGESFYGSGNHNSANGKWTLLQDTTVSGGGWGKIVPAPDFDAPLWVSAGEKISFTVVYVHGSYMHYYKGVGYGNSGANFDEFVSSENDDLIMYEGARISDWEGDWSSSSSSTANKYYKYDFEGKVRYQVKNGGSSIDPPPATGGMAAPSIEGMAADAADEGPVETASDYAADEEEEEEIVVDGTCGATGQPCEHSFECCDFLECLGTAKCGFPETVSG